MIEANVATTIGPAAVQPGDAVIVSGDLGRHGVAILSVREGPRIRVAHCQRHSFGMAFR